MVVECALLLITNFADTNYSSQFFCLWSTKNWRYCSNSWFIYFVYLSVWEWNDVDSFVLISNMLFNSLIISAVNYSPLSNTILFSNPYNFYILSLNSLANPSADVSFIIATKCVILDNLLQMTRIISFLATNSNFVIKFTIRCVYGFSRTSLNFNFSTGTSVLFFILWHISHFSMYLPTFLVIPSH